MTIRPTTPDRPVVIALGLLLVVGAAAACSLLPPASPAALAASPLVPAPSPSPVPVSGPPGAPGGASAGAPPPQSSGLHAVVDPTLLKVLPGTVGGARVEEFPDAERQAVNDPDLGRNVSRVATAFAADTAGANWVYTAIVDVRPEAQSDAFYRDWQESFDTSACERAGGVTGHTSAVIAGHDVERTACGQGVRTYHLRIAGTGLLLSISSLGDGQFGELEIVGLP